MSDTLNLRDAIARIQITSDTPSRSAAHRAAEPPDDRPVITRLGAEVGITYLVEADGEFVPVRERHLDQLDGRRDRLARIGLHNLMVRAAERMEVRTYNNVFTVSLDGHFEASLSLLNTLWDERLAGMVPSSPVLAMPTHDVLAFCDAGSSQGIAELCEMVARVWRNTPPGKALSRDLFHRRTGHWKRIRTPAAA